MLSVLSCAHACATINNLTATATATGHWRVQEKSATERAKRMPLKALVLAPALVSHQRLVLRVLRWMSNLIALHGASASLFLATTLLLRSTFSYVESHLRLKL